MAAINTTVNATIIIPTLSTMLRQHFYLVPASKKLNFFQENMFFISCSTGGVLVLISSIILVCAWAR